MLLPLAATGFGLVAAASARGVISIAAQFRDRTPRDNFYEDEDGKSTPEAMAKFSQKYVKTAVFLFALLIFELSVAISTLETLKSSTYHGSILVNWLSTGIQALLLLQAVILLVHRSPTESFKLGIYLLFSSVFSAAVHVPQAIDADTRMSWHGHGILIIRVIDCAALLLLAISSVLLQRRPSVFRRDREVSRENTVSLLSRGTWAWARPLLDLATKKGDLDQKDIPEPDHTLRADLLVETWNNYQFSGKLVWSLIWAYKYSIGLQWSVTLARSVLGLAPFLIMYRLIDGLEKRAVGIEPALSLWALVILLGFVTLTEQWINGWVNWFSINQVAFPMRGQLSAIIFEKSLRRKNVKIAEKNTDEAKDDKGKAKKADNQNGDDANNENTDDSNNTKKDKKKDKKDAKKDAKKEKEDETVLKSRQAIVNLVGVDARRISSFAMFQFLIIDSVGRLILYSVVLIQLIGWLPFGAGLMAWALVLPFNTYASKYYMRASETLMKTRDEKLAVVNEALLGMRQIKFSALEKEWQGRIWAMREKELKQLIKVFIGDTVLFCCWVISPILLAAVSLAVYATVHQELTPKIAFTSIGIFKGLELALGGLPEFLTAGIDTLVSIRRVDAYLKGPEMTKVISEGSDIAFENASVAWPIDEEKTPDEERFILNQLDLSFPAGELSVVSGKTGSGKSLLLNALLGEVDLMQGAINMPRPVPILERNDAKAHPGNWILPGTVAYVSQVPWLESTSLRENIIFGMPLVEERYNEVLEVCALKKDLEILTDGDKTELGANGINLSGGQKWRVTLARAIYSRAEILIMDDIFSAVDAHVGRHIFEKCVAGPLCQGRTRILVTHHVGLVESQAKYLVELGEGTVLHAGLTSDLAEDGTLQKIRTNEQAEILDEGNGESSTAVNSERASVAEGSDANGTKKTDESPSEEAPKDKKDAKKYIEDESREKGMVKSHVYATYLKDSGGVFFWIVCVIIYTSFEAGDIGRNWWLRIWTGQSQESSVTTLHVQQASSTIANIFSFQPNQDVFMSAQNTTGGSPAPQQHSLNFYLWIYVTLAFATGLVGTLRFVWTFYMSLKASRALFDKILFTVLRTPLRWLDTVPVGRILNRMTADFDIVDNRIAMDISMLFWHLLGLLGVCVAALLVTWKILPVAIVLVVVAGVVGKKYMDGARPVKRLESTAKSPVFEIFNAALSGVATVRAYQKTKVYVERMYDHLDNWDVINVHMWLMNRWMGFRMAVIGTIFTTCIGLIVVTSPFVDAALGGFTLSFALDFASYILWSIRMYANLELDMNAAERVIEYSQLKTESLEGDEPPAAWPTSGRIEVEDLVVSYADDLPPVLKGISFHVGNNERIGVVGRTGAGKSSLTLALFRFLEARSGKVIIDGIEISKMDLHSLRSRLAIIPQDPVLFSGTVRSNLDPFDDRSDDELREALSRVHLLDSQPVTPANEPSSSANSTIVPKNANVFKDLSSGIAESGGNLSQGQRQLLCLARAIVSRPKIMVLDEATSAVDMATDSLIQRSIREEFTDSTLIVIAHRLSTIADFDRILVLSDGTVAEFGSPKELYEKEDSLFRDMCNSSGEKEKLKDIIMSN